MLLNARLVSFSFYRTRALGVAKLVQWLSRRGCDSPASAPDTRLARWSTCRRGSCRRALARMDRHRFSGNGRGGANRPSCSTCCPFRPRKGPTIRTFTPRAARVDHCVSACTILVGYIPRNNICVMPNAYLGFHWATTDFHTREMWSVYPPDIRQWISQHGGLTSQMLWLQAPSIYRYFRKC